MNPDEASRDKTVLRASIRTGRQARTAQQRAIAGERIREFVLKTLAELRPTAVACFTSTETEPPTDALITALQRQGIVTLTPRVNSAELDWVITTAASEFRVGAFAIPEVLDGQIVPLTQAQVILVPALAVDTNGIRLGQGGGFYDRAIGRLTTPPMLIAIVFSDEDEQAVPVEPHDVAVDAVVSDAGVRWIRRRETQSSR